MDWNGAARLAGEVAALWDGGPGGAFALFDASGVRATACGGLASLETGHPFTADTPSRYASISKHMLAACLLLEGVPLDEPLAGLLPGLPAAFAAVPLGRALDMTAGLPDMMEVLWQLGTPFTATIGAEEVLAVLRRLRRLCAPPGQEMAYSNTGWRLGQMLLEARSATPYAALLRRLLFQPLGLAMAFPYDETEPVPGLATGYWPGPAGWRRGRYGMHMSGSGGIAGSATALARWAGALMQGRPPLAGMLDRLASPRPFGDGSPSAYRLGLVESWLGGTRLLGHGGSLPGYRNHLLLAPAQGVGVVLLTNRDEDPLEPALRVMAALLGASPPRPAPTPAPGLFAAPAGTDWAEIHPGAIEFMGARETVVAAGERLRSIPGSLEMDVSASDDALEGPIGGVPRRLHRVPPGTPLDPGLVGEWREETFGVTLAVAGDGTARWPWPGTPTATRLTPLPAGRALADLRHLMWRHRPCLSLDGDGGLVLASHRARVLRFRRG